MNNIQDADKKAKRAATQAHNLRLQAKQEKMIAETDSEIHFFLVNGTLTNDQNQVQLEGRRKKPVMVRKIYFVGTDSGLAHQVHNSVAGVEASRIRKQAFSARWSKWCR